MAKQIDPTETIYSEFSVDKTSKDERLAFQNRPGPVVNVVAKTINITVEAKTKTVKSITRSFEEIRSNSGAFLGLISYGFAMTSVYLFGNGFILPGWISLIFALLFVKAKHLPKQGGWIVEMLKRKPSWWKNKG